MTILGNRILIEPSEAIDKLPSGIYLPQTAVEKPNTGKVVLVGEKADKSLLGKSIMYNPLTAITIENKHLLHVSDIKIIL